MNTSLEQTAGTNGPSSKPNPVEPVVCFTNIGPQQQRKRMAFGVVAFAVGIGFAALLFLIDANIWWRVLLFLPFASAGISYFQARDKT